MHWRVFALTGDANPALLQCETSIAAGLILNIFPLLAGLGLALLCSKTPAAPRQPSAKPPLIIGMSAPLSGSAGTYGQAMQQAISAHFHQLNAGGGIHGRRLKLVVFDDAYRSEQTTTNARRLIEREQAFALIGFYGSSATTQALTQVIGPAKVPLIGTVSGAEELRTAPQHTAHTRYLFNTRASYADETAAIAHQLVALGLTKIAIAYQNDGFGESGLKGLNQALKQHQLQPVVSIALDKETPNPEAAATAIAPLHPQAIVIAALHQAAAGLVQQLRQRGQFPMFTALSPVGTEALIGELGEAARGIGIAQVVPHPWNDAIPVVRRYQQLSTQHPYSYYGLEAYLMARTLEEGLRRAGPNPSREKLIKSLETMQSVDLGGFRISYSPQSHQGSNFVELTVIGPGGKIMR